MESAHCSMKLSCLLFVIFCFLGLGIGYSFEPVLNPIELSDNILYGQHKHEPLIAPKSAHHKVKDSVRSKSIPKEITKPKSKLDVYHEKLSTYKGMTSAGGILLGLGLISVPVGITKLAKSESETIHQPGGIQINYYGEDAKAGIFFILFGIPSTISGIVLSSIGSRKVKEYRNKINLQNVSIGGSQNSISLSVTISIHK